MAAYNAAVASHQSVKSLADEFAVAEFVAPDYEPEEYGSDGGGSEDDAALRYAKMRLLDSMAEDAESKELNCDARETVCLEEELV